jgi:hypothetical protein
VKSKMTVRVRVSDLYINIFVDFLAIYTLKLFDFIEADAGNVYYKIGRELMPLGYVLSTS